MLMDKKQKKMMLIIFGVIAAILLAGIFLTSGGAGEEESVQVVMRDAVLHDVNKVNFFGLEINPGLAAGFTVTGILTLAALIIRIFVIPKFTIVPGKFQMLLETLVGYFNNLGKTNSPHLNRVLGGYVFAAGVYIFTGTMLELFGIQVMTTGGHSVSMPAPLSDVNGAIMMGCTSYLFILTGGIAAHGFKGILKTLKEFSLPISMSFRLFGALLSGALVTELVYYYTTLSYVLPVIVGVLFTCLHALIQAYVLTMLVSIFYGEVSEPEEPKIKSKKAKAVKA
ncbi:MAG: F0F1 ATP synthase subunit A [Firmicutes bacterium]|nr:F0F1 ATP synthase subunit A [Bacillota bacterium]